MSGGSRALFRVHLSRLRKDQTTADSNKEMKKKEQQEQQRYYAIRFKLKQQGLIARAQENKQTLWGLTEKGTRMLTALRKKLSEGEPYRQPTPTAETYMVIFDIPERENNKRQWIRSALRNLHFQKVQESVWMGKYKIPETFLADLHDRRMAQYVEIFEVRKLGTLA
jgi:DNA-binding transcriptional regulator PaaX